MTPLIVKLTVDAAAVNAVLFDLNASLESRLEIREALIHFLDSGEQFFRIDSDVFPASDAGEFIVRLHPSDALLGLMAAARAGDTDLRIFEHATSPVDFLDVITTSEPMQ
ncbi:hypothetical protein HJA82_02120 [Rhizobium bangladeshense]|uniref:hypothetical protein n=1 Tax=Rhizobium bangladeshense TaxID=1138189 RepID=UPI001C8392DD|nr:hypothetical protein [Rhizobium bangladeshense]MBX4906182.1 hypothetical protein [Rhizobium bangladeshense]